MRQVTVRFLFWVSIASLAFFVMASSSPQCSQTNDQALNPTLDPATSELAQCKQACVAAMQEGFRIEKARYAAAKEACNGDAICREQETYLNTMIKAELVIDKDECQFACEHNQGSGSGGQ